MAYQYRAVTGRRRPSRYRDIIEAQTPYLASLYAQKEKDRHTKRSYAQDELALSREGTLAMERLGLRREEIDAQEAHNREQLELMGDVQGEGQKQTMIGQGIGVGQLGISGYNAYNLFKDPTLKPPVEGKGLTLPSEPKGYTFPATEESIVNMSKIGDKWAAVDSTVPVPASQTIADMTAGGLTHTPPQATFNVPGYEATMAKLTTTGGGAELGPALFAEGGAGATTLPSTTTIPGYEAAAAGLETATPTLSAIEAGGGAEMATPATATPATGGFAAGAKAFGAGMLGYPVGYYGSKMAGEKDPVKQHGYGLAGTSLAAGAWYAATLNPWGFLALPVMAATDPKGTKELGRKHERELIRRPLKQAEKYTREAVRDPVETTKKVVVDAPVRAVKSIASAVSRVFKSCIIITACTDPNSYEVNVTRRYRDRIMHPTTLRGYYMLAEKVVPLIHKSDKLKHFLKKHLVDSLVDTLEWKLGEKAEKPKTKSRLITAAFLSSCRLLGLTKKQFKRCNGEVF